MPDLSRRLDFLIAAFVFEGGLLGVAQILGWVFGVNPWETLKPDWTGTGWGIAATLPMLVFFAAAYRYPVGPFRKIRQILLETLGPSLAACRWYDLVLIAGIAGLGEELLFRGVLQPRFGLLASNAVFGLAHAITPLYAVLAGALGAYLGWLATASQNLLVPIVAHALYDLVAFLVVAREARRARVLPQSPGLDTNSRS